ncbi:MAG: T9SS type A sorting domain-containing protein [Bacteroidetes bacterium]|nr:T9SS type A sorting domain-containing protein [Bacteroidota bacterium]
MRTTMQLFTRGVFVTLIVFLTSFGTSSGQATYTLSTANCTTTANSFEFDVMATNTGAGDLRMNGTVIRGTLSPAIIAAGTNTIAFSFVNDGQSIIPNSFPPNSVITFTYNATSRLFQVSTLNTVYNNNTCTAPLIAAGTSGKIGRFRLANSTNNFVPGAAATFTWNTTASIIAYENCTTTTSLSLVKTLATPCSVLIPSAGCTMTASIASQVNVLCFGESTGSATATTLSAPGAVTYSWNTTPVQTGATATGLAAGPYTVVATSGACTASATVTITGPASAVVASASQDAPILCNGGSTTVTVSATGGTGPYTGTGTFPATAGPYSYTVTDANGCTSVASGTLSQPDALSASASATPTSTPSATDGTATATVNGGTGPYTITWNTTPTQSGPTATGLAAGSYIATIVDANGCSTQASATVTSPSCLLVASSSQGAAILCFGGTTTVTVSQTGGVEPVTGTGTFTVGAGTHSYTVTDGNGCTSTTSITVSEPTEVVASSSATAILCNGGSSTVTVSATGGTAPYTGTGSFTETAGTYTYTVTDGNGCTATTTVTISEPSALSASSSSSAILCNGGSSTVTVSATGGTAPYTGTGSFSEVAGTYTYTVTDANGCTATTSVTITEPSALVASSSQGAAILCNGGTTTVTVSATGGTAPYTGTGVVTAGAGTHTYTVTDANGCTSTTSITITEPSVLVASSSATAILCNGGSSTVTVSATGGTPTYIGVGTFTVSAGTHTYTVTDLNGCSATTTITVTEPAALAATATATNSSCPTCADGTVSITSVTGGTAPYSSTDLTGLLPGNYCITVTDANGCTTSACATVGSTACAIVASSTQNSPILCNGGTTTVTVSQTGGVAPITGTGTFTVGAGTHSYTVTDVNGCTSTTSITVTEPSVLSASSSQGAAILCNGGTTTVTVSATGGTAPYTGTGVITAGAGTHTYTVTDANGCTSTTSITITEPSAVVASSSSTAILCNGGSSTVTVSATGGTAPYTGTGSFTEAAGTYTYTVTDANGCTATTTITITEPSAVVASSSSTAILCNGGSSTVTVSATGGTAPYTGTGSFTETAGTYTYTVTDANGCSATTTITITEPSTVVASSSATAILCNGGSSTVTVSATGGTAPYSGTGSFSVTAGTYNYTVTDANGCASTTSITVTEPSALSASSSQGAAILCFGGTTTVTVSATGGTAPYSGTGSFTAGAGSPVYTVTDANGCTTTTTITISQPTKVEGTTTTTAASGCSVADGTATVTPTGGNPGYTYLWSNAQTTQTATGLAAGSYTVQITDANGCSGSATAVVTGSGGSVGTPGAISGAPGACRNSSGIVYSVAAVPGATSYVWTLPAGATGSSTTNSITVAFNGTYAGGFICVAASNTCGTGATSCLNIPVITAYPGLPAVITGPSVTCGAGLFTFSTTSSNATSYNWTVTGTGAFISSGQGTNTIVVSVPLNFAQGSVQVRGVNCNGISAVRGMTITGVPAHSNAISGPNLVCANGTATYVMPVVPGVSSYVWSVTGNASVGSQTLTSTTSSAVINFGPTWTSGTVSIAVFNSCGSYTRTFAVGSVPNQPGGISGPGTALCGLSNVTYSIAAVPGATSYTWTVPVGASVMSTSPDGRTIVVDFPSFVGTGNICVTANNACGQGPARCYAVTARPGVPVVTGPTTVCKTQSSVPYSLAPVTGATSYSWSITGGAAISPSGTTAIVNYNTALSTSAVIRANAVNACGASQPGGLTVAVSLFCRTAADNVSVSSTELGAYPNPTSGKATVSFNAASESKYLVKVMDMIGNTLVSDVVNAIEGYNTQDIDLTGVAKGIYMISVTAADGTTETIRLVVE